METSIQSMVQVQAYSLSPTGNWVLSKSIQDDDDNP